MKTAVLAGLFCALWTSAVGAQAPTPAQTAKPSQIPAPPSHPVVVRNPEWLRKPSYSQLSAVYPPATVGGRGAVDCFVTPQGILHDCRISVDEPVGHGFGQSVLAIASQYIMKPAMRDGKPAEAVTRVGVEFKSNGDAPRGYREPITIVLSEVAWLKAPKVTDILAELDKKAGAKSADPDGAVLIQCALDDSSGKLSGCDPIYESPGLEGFTETARSLTRKFEADPNRLLHSRSHLRVNLIFRFPDMRSPDWSQRHLTRVTWKQTMNLNQDATLYPAAATKAGLNSGSALVDCVLNEAGVFTACDILRESNAGLGFGEAARRKIQDAFVNPWDDGLPVDGSHVRTTVRLDAPPVAAGTAPVVSASPAPPP